MDGAVAIPSGLLFSDNQAYVSDEANGSRMLQPRWSSQTPSLRSVCAALVEMLLVIEKLSLQIHKGPEECMIQKLAANTSDQPLHEREGNW